MQKQCVRCGSEFEITNDDLIFYEKISPVFEDRKYKIPPPTYCPDCRLQRRLTWRNDLSLYKRTCDKTGKQIISLHHPESPYTVFDNKVWWSDAWDPLSYGRDIDFNRPFFEQYAELHKQVPQQAIINDNGVQSENCEYCQDFAFGKDCYLVNIGWHTQDSYYCYSVTSYTKNIVDCFFTTYSELCYECQHCKKVHSSCFLQNCENCSDCFLGLDMKGCNHCFCCYGLRHKEYHIFNKPYSKEEYDKKIQTFQTHTHSGLMKLRKEFNEWSMKFPRRESYMQNCENCTGDHLFNCRDTYGFDNINAEFCRYYDKGDSPKWSHDCFVSGNNELCYEGITPDNSYQTHFTTWCWKNKYILYSDSCHSSQHCFGCVSLKRAHYCIFNKQYTKEEYEKLVPKLIAHMQNTGEWGEFFPASISPYGYNETVAQDYFPLDKNQAISKGFLWREVQQSVPDVEKIIAAHQLPDSVDAVPDDILNWAIKCSETNRPYRIQKGELNFYRKMHLPIPHLHPDKRHQERTKRRNPRKIWDRKCNKCGRSIKTTYAPERPEIIYCEECYLQEMY